MRRRDLSRRVTEHAHFGSVKWCIKLECWETSDNILVCCDWKHLLLLHGTCLLVLQLDTTTM